MDVLDLIRRGYAAIGLGVDPDVLAMFDHLDGQEGRWIVFSIDYPRERPPGEVVALELFGGLPQQYEVMAVEAESWKYDERRSVLTVSGHFRTRPRGTWEVFSLPFVHVWSIAGGRVQRVLSCLNGVELRRRARAA